MIAYFDVFVGISGDMILGALVDAGLPVAELEGVIQGLGLSDQVALQVERVQKGPLAATKVTVITYGEPDRPHAHLRHVPSHHEHHEH